MIPMLQEETRKVQLGRKGGAEHALGEKGEDSQSPPPLAFPHCFYVFLQVHQRLRSLRMNTASLSDALAVLSTLHSEIPPKSVFPLAHPNNISGWVGTRTVCLLKSVHFPRFKRINLSSQALWCDNLRAFSQTCYLCPPSFSLSSYVVPAH